MFRLRTGEVSMPIRTDRGYVVLSVKDIQPAHQGTLDEARARVISDLQKQKAAELVVSKAEDLSRRVKAGEKFDAVAKSLGLEPKMSDPFARNGSVPGLGSGKQLSAAFDMKDGEVSAPVPLGASRAVYEIVEKTTLDQADFAKQAKDLTDAVIQNKRNLAFEAFRAALEARLKQEGKLTLYPDKLKTSSNLG
jgi:peptidyl-prolyl cis-trans isomerase D